MNQSPFGTDLFDIPLASRKKDPATSREAASINHHAARVAALLAHADNPDGLTDFELASIIGRQQTSAGKRRGELRDNGLIEGTSIRRPSPSGVAATVWRITADGKFAAQRMRGGR